jgi:hypothetical protein
MIETLSCKRMLFFSCRARQIAWLNQAGIPTKALHFSRNYCVAQERCRVAAAAAGDSFLVH